MQATDTEAEFLTHAEAHTAYLEAAKVAKAAEKAAAAAGRIERATAKAAKDAWEVYNDAAKDAATLAAAPADLPPVRHESDWYTDGADFTAPH